MSNKKGSMLMLTWTIAVLGLAGPTWAGQGWYLMAPPRITVLGTPTLSDSAPLSEWRHLESYDSAPICEQDKARKWERYTYKAAQLRENKILERMAEDHLYARCIASDDPRLVSKP